MAQPLITPTPNSEILKRMGFTQITGCAESDSCLFMRKEEGDEEPTASLADLSTGIIFTMSKADWSELLAKIKSGEIT